MKTKCRAMVLVSPETMEMRTFDLPETGEEDGLLEVELVGVCGSDPGIFRGKQTFGPRPFPIIMGHEIVGRIAAMGRGVRERHGVVEGDRMADVVMDVSGHPSGAELGLPLVGRRGTFILPGLYKHQKASLDLDLVVTKEIRVQGVYSHDSRAVRPAIKMARSGKYPFEELITHTLPLAQAERAVRLAAGEIEGESPLKVVLDPKG